MEIPTETRVIWSFVFFVPFNMENPLSKPLTQEKKGWRNLFIFRMNRIR